MCCHKRVKRFQKTKINLNSLIIVIAKVLIAKQLFGQFCPNADFQSGILLHQSTLGIWLASKLDIWLKVQFEFFVNLAAVNFFAVALTLCVCAKFHRSFFVFVLCFQSNFPPFTKWKINYTPTKTLAPAITRKREIDESLQIKSENTRKTMLQLNAQCTGTNTIANRSNGAKEKENK